MDNIIKTWITSFFICLVFILFLGSFEIINAGHRGVELTMGKPSEIALGEGLHFKVPIFQTIKEISVQTEKYVVPASAASSDLQIITSEIAVNYHLSPSNVPQLYTNIGMDFEDKVIQPTIQEVLKSTTAKFTAEQLISNRSQVKFQIEEVLIERLLKYNIIVEQVSITDFDFSDSFNAAIDAKVVAEQEIFQEQNRLIKEVILADKQIEQARGNAQSKMKNADAIAYEKTVVADAEAYALRVVREELAQSDDLIKYETVKKWLGNVPLYTGSGIVPFIDITTEIQG